MSNDARNLPAVSAARTPAEWQQLTTFDAVERYATKICGAGWVPKGYMKDGRPNQAMVEVGIMHGQEIGLSPMAALQTIAVINGMPSLWGDGMLAVVEASGLMEDIEERFDGEGEQLAAVCTVKRRGRPTPIVQRFSIAMAKKAGLWGKSGPWSQYPQRMLTLRARAWALRNAFSDVIKGMRVAEEVIDGGELVAQPDGSFAATGQPAPPRPTRSEFTAPPADTVTDVEPEEAPERFDLIDEFGEVAREELAANAFLDVLEDRLGKAGQPDALWEHNADAAERAAEMVENGDEILARLRQAVEPKPDATDWPAKVAELKAEAGECKSIDALVAFKAKHAATLKAIPDDLFPDWNDFTDALAAKLKGVK